MIDLLLTGLATVAGYFFARLVDEAVGLDALAADLAAWLQSVGVPRYTGGTAA